MTATMNKIQISGQDVKTVDNVAKILSKIRGRKVSSSEAVGFVVKSLKINPESKAQFVKYLQQRTHRNIK